MVNIALNDENNLSVPIKITKIAQFRACCRF